MRMISKYLAPSMFSALLASQVLLAGCAVHARVYDPYHRDYHAWAGEEPYYEQWERDTHRDHRKYDKRGDDDKKGYWDWRHSHSDQH